MKTPIHSHTRTPYIHIKNAPKHNKYEKIDVNSIKEKGPNLSYMTNFQIYSHQQQYIYFLHLALLAIPQEKNLLKI